MKQTILTVALVITMSAALHAQTNMQSKNAVYPVNKGGCISFLDKVMIGKLLQRKAHE